MDAVSWVNCSLVGSPYVPNMGLPAIGGSLGNCRAMWGVSGFNPYRFLRWPSM